MSALSEKNELVGATLYFDCATGLAGDMILAALLDLGVPESFVRQQLALLPLEQWELRVTQVKRHGLVGKKVDVVDFSDANAHTHVHYGEIRSMLEAAALLPDTKRRALDMFEKLAHVEAALHGTTVADVAFHEVGALDSIVDIVGIAAALSWLSPSRVVSRKVPVGFGQVRTAHGFLPVPAPATSALLKGAQVEAGDALGELTTPTGALVVSTFADGYDTLPSMKVVAVGHGAGTRDLPDRPNMLRIFAGRETRPETAAHKHTAQTETMWELAANLDDMNPQLLPPIVESLLLRGAKDVWLVPVAMKKGRPGVVLHVICDGEHRQELAALVLRETTTLGVRFHSVERLVLVRETVCVKTEHGPVEIKLGRDPATGDILNAAPEYETVVKLSVQTGIPIKRMYAEAVSIAAEFLRQQ